MYYIGIGEDFIVWLIQIIIIMIIIMAITIIMMIMMITIMITNLYCIELAVLLLNHKVLYLLQEMLLHLVH